MNTFLPPIEKPDSLIMRLVYYFTKKQLGIVITSLKVFSARLPDAFGMFYGKVSQLDKKLKLSKELAIILRQQVSSLNVCEFCLDAGKAAAIKATMDLTKFENLAEYRSSQLYNPGEKAALDYVSELTVEKRVSQSTFDNLAKHFSEREICEIVYLAASEHLYNITNIGLNIQSDMLCSILKKR